MKPHFVLFLALALTLMGCGSAATQPASPSPTPQATLSSGVVDKSGVGAGLYFTYPVGWEVLEADPRGMVIYSVKDAGLRLFNPGLQAGEVVVQVSATPRMRVEADLTSYITSLGMLTQAEFGEPQPITINGFNGYQLQGEYEAFSVIITITEQNTELIEVIAYTNPAEASQYRPIIDSIINSAIWKLPTE